MNKITSSKIVALFAAAALTAASLVMSAMATEEPQFVARGGGESITANANGGVTVQTAGNPGGGVKSAEAHLADGLSVTLNYNAATAAACPTKAIYMLSFTDIQHATPNGGDASNGFFFQYDLNVADDQIIVNMFPKKNVAGTVSDITAGKSFYLSITGDNTFTLTKQADGKYTFSHNGAALFTDLELAGLIPAGGLYVNNYLAATKDAGVLEDNYTISVTSTPKSAAVNGLLGLNGAVLTASGEKGASFVTENAFGAMTEKRVKLDGLSVSFAYAGCKSTTLSPAADPDIYRLSFTNVPGGNIGDSAVRQKGFYIQFANYNNLGVAEGGEGQNPENTGGISIYEGKTRDVNEHTASYALLSEGRHLVSGSVFTFTFARVGTEGSKYSITYTDDHNQAEPKVYAAEVDLTDCLDADGCVYIGFLAAAMAAGTNEVTNTITVDGTYTDAPAEQMPPIVEEGEYTTLTDANGFTFTNIDSQYDEAGKVYNATVAPFSYNGYSISGKSLRVLAQSKAAWTLDGMEFSITPKTPIPAGAFYQIALTKEAGMLERDDAGAGKGVILTVQHATAEGTIYTYAWNGPAQVQNKDGADSTIKPQFDGYHAGDTITCRFIKNEDGTYNYLMKANDGNYEAIAVNMNLSDLLNGDGKVFLNIKVANTTDVLAYDLALLSVPMPKEEAQKAIDDTESLQKDDFTAETWSVFEAARDALQKAIDEDVANLNDLYKAFVNALNKLENIDPVQAAFDKLIADIEAEFKDDESLKEADYSAADWKAYSEAKAALQTMLDNGNGYDDVKAAFDAYVAAKAALKGDAPQTGVANTAAGAACILMLSCAAVFVLKRKKAE